MGTSYRATGAFRKRGVVSRLSDLIWPPRSLLSDAFVDRPGVIEAELWGELKFLTEPQCTCCGFPLPDGANPGDLCGACAAHSPAYDTARAALAYEDHARRLILDLKRGGRRDGLPVFAKWMSTAASEALAKADFVAPAPMHWTRLAMRSFNQAAWLAQAVARAGGKQWKPGALRRVKRRKSQAACRRRNGAGTWAAQLRRPVAMTAKRSSS